MPVIFFEGADGSGKNSLIDDLYNNYRALGKDVKIYNDGYGLTYPEEYSNLIKKPRISNKARFLLLQSIRADLYQTILDQYNKNPNSILLVNRSILSSLVYQCLANYNYSNENKSIIQQYYDNEEFKKNNYLIQDFSSIVEMTLPFNFINRIKPIVVYLHCSLETCISRDAKMCDWRDNYQFDTYNSKKDFLRNVLLCYNSIFQVNPTFQGNMIINSLFDQLQNNYSLFTLIFESEQIILNATKTKEEVYQEFLKHIGNIIE